MQVTFKLTNSLVLAVRRKAKKDGTPIQVVTVVDDAGSPLETVFHDVSRFEVIEELARTRSPLNAQVCVKAGTWKDQRTGQERGYANAQMLDFEASDAVPQWRQNVQAHEMENPFPTPEQHAAPAAEAGVDMMELARMVAQVMQEQNAASTPPETGGAGE